METGRLVDTAQGAFDFELSSTSAATGGAAPPEAASAAALPSPPVRFEEGQRSRLFIGPTPLSRYLEEVGLSWVVELVEVLEREVDFSAFLTAYKPGGRPPLHPRLLVGLFVYGMLLKQWSLRELEALARRDVGAWWVCAGLQPDHSTLGRFALRHLALLSEDFFLQVTRAAVKRLGLVAGQVAGDGTLVEAAASMASVVRRAALEEQAPAAEGERLAQLQRAETVLTEREQARGAQGKPSSDVQVAVGEEDAVVQPLKDGRLRPAYKPSLLVHEKGLILGQTLHPSSETEAVASLLVQHGQVLGALPGRALFDAGYCTLGVLQLSVEVGLDVLTPAGRTQRRADEEEEEGFFHKRGQRGRYGKGAFHYLPEEDAYRCPQGARLTPCGKPQQDRAGRPYQEYVAPPAACRTCPLAARCTTAKKGRRLKRYAGEELKEAMAAVFTQPQARAAFRQRSAWVEPVFGRLKAHQGLTRFHRRGEAKARLEFALHCSAYNLKRAVDGRQQALLLLLLFARAPAHPWRLVGGRALLWRA